ncbi:MAG: prephenate dehydratase [Alistipes sp.]|jgi:prephenate dehydratase|nr:prephenate dehydratase [Alistipes sp.]
MRIAIQGYEGSFHQIVAESCFGREAGIIPCDTFREVARRVKSGEAAFGVMAVENSIAGTIIANYGILQEAGVQVAGEYYLRIVQNLVALPGTRLEDITEVESHPMALQQCHNFLDTHPDWRLVESEDTALSARRVAEKGLGTTAAIASESAARLYGLEIVAPEINTIKNNHTRFVIIKVQDLLIAPDANKASLYFKTDHSPGSLVRALGVLDGVNMSRLQSHPIPAEPWHYMFHIDLEFPSLDIYAANLERLVRATEEVHVYGVYPSGLKKNDNI